MWEARSEEKYDLRKKTFTLEIVVWLMRFDARDVRVG